MGARRIAEHRLAETCDALFLSRSCRRVSPLTRSSGEAAGGGFQMKLHKALWAREQAERTGLMVVLVSAADLAVVLAIAWRGRFRCGMRSASATGSGTPGVGCRRGSLKWNGMEWTEWNGMEWNGMEWNDPGMDRMEKADIVREACAQGTPRRPSVVTSRCRRRALRPPVMPAACACAGGFCRCRRRRPDAVAA